MSQPTLPLSKPTIEDSRNVLDCYKDWDTADIKAAIDKTKNGFSVAVFQLAGDYNFSSIVRSANAFGAERVYYIGRKRWDKRGAVGTHHYMDVIHCKDYNDFLDRAVYDHILVAVENNVDYKCHDLRTYDWDDQNKSLMIFGEEGHGLPDEVLSQVDYIVSIPQCGSVRSLNAASAATVVMYDFISKKT